MSMTLELNFRPNAILENDGWEDLTAALLESGFQRKRCYGKQGKMEQQTVSMQLLPVVGGRNIAMEILSSETVRARLKDGDTPYFIGTLRPLVTVTADSILRPFSCQIVDDSLILEHTWSGGRCTTYGIQGMTLVNSDPSLSLVHWLISHVRTTGENPPRNIWSDSSIVIGDSVPGDIDVSGFVLSPGDGVKGILDTLMYEHGLQYRFDGSGRIRIDRSVYEDTDGLADGAVPFGDTSMVKSLSVKRGDGKHKGAIVTWTPIDEHPRTVTVARSASEYFEIPAEGRYLKLPLSDSTEFTLSDTDIDDSGVRVAGYTITSLGVKRFLNTGKAWQWNGLYYRYKDQNCIHITTEDVPGQEEGVYVRKVKVTRTGDRAQWYDGHVDLTCLCTVADTRDAEQVRSATALNPEKYTAKYVHKKDRAEALMRMMDARNASGNVTYSFGTLRTDIEPGMKLHLVSLSAGVDTYVRVLSVTDGGPGLQDPVRSVVCEGLEALEEIAGETVAGLQSYASRTADVKLAVRSETSVVASGTENVTAVAWGSFVDNRRAPVAWSLNGTALDETGSIVRIPVSSLTAGENTLSASSVHDGETAEASLVWTLVAAAGIAPVSDQVQFCLTSSFSTAPGEDDDGWSDEPPRYGEDPQQPQTRSLTATERAVWMRRHVTYSNGSDFMSEPVCINSPGVIALYRYGMSRMEPPMTSRYAGWDVNIPLFWAGLLITVDSGAGRWQEDIPSPADGKPYLWMAVSIDNGETWRFTCLTGEEPKTFSVTAEPPVMVYSRRHRTVTTVTLSASWTGYPSGAETVYETETGTVTGDAWAVTASQVPQDVAVLVARLVHGGETLATYEVRVPVTTTDTETVYWGKGEPAEGDWLEGDHYLGPDGVPHRCPADGTAPPWPYLMVGDSGYSQIMAAVMADAFSEITEGSTARADFGFFRNILASYVTTMVLELIQGGEIRSAGYAQGAERGFRLTHGGDAWFNNISITKGSADFGSMRIAPEGAENVSVEVVSGKYQARTVYNSLAGKNAGLVGRQIGCTVGGQPSWGYVKAENRGSMTAGELRAMGINISSAIPAGTAMTGDFYIVTFYTSADTVAARSESFCNMRVMGATMGDVGMDVSISSLTVNVGGNVLYLDVPSSSAGLARGRVYQEGGILKVVT